MVCLHYRGFVGWLKYSFPFLPKWLKYSLPFTRLFNDYLGSLTNTPVVQRLPQLFNDYNDKKATKLSIPREIAQHDRSN